MSAYFEPTGVIAGRCYRCMDTVQIERHNIGLEDGRSMDKKQLNKAIEEAYTKADEVMKKMLNDKTLCFCLKWGFTTYGNGLWAAREELDAKTS